MFSASGFGGYACSVKKSELKLILSETDGDERIPNPLSLLATMKKWVARIVEPISESPVTIDAPYISSTLIHISTYTYPNILIFLIKRNIYIGVSMQTRPKVL